MEEQKKKASPVTPPKASAPWWKGSTGYSKEGPCTKGNCKEPSTKEGCRGSSKQQLDWSNHSRSSFREGRFKGQGTQTFQEPVTQAGVRDKAEEEVSKEVWWGPSEIRRPHFKRSRSSSLKGEQRRKRQREEQGKTKRKERARGSRKEKERRTRAGVLGGARAVEEMEARPERPCNGAVNSVSLKSW